LSEKDSVWDFVNNIGIAMRSLDIKGRIATNLFTWRVTTSSNHEVIKFTDIDTLTKVNKAIEQIFSLKNIDYWFSHLDLWQKYKNIEDMDNFIATLKNKLDYDKLFSWESLYIDIYGIDIKIKFDILTNIIRIDMFN
jgi:hypothetical protein